MQTRAIITLTLVLQFTVSCAENSAHEKASSAAASPVNVEEYRTMYSKAGHDYAYVVKVQGSYIESTLYYFNNPSWFNSAIVRKRVGSLLNGEVVITSETCPSNGEKLSAAGMERLDGFTKWLKDVHGLTSVQEDVNCDLIP